MKTADNGTGIIFLVLAIAAICGLLFIIMAACDGEIAMLLEGVL